MLIRKSSDIASSEITPEAVWRSRREWIAKMGLGAAALGAGGTFALRQAGAAETGERLAATLNPAYSVMEKQTSFEDATSYNNYYEFGTDKGDPADYAGALKTEPWQVSVEGEVAKPRTFDLDALRKLAGMEERVYRLRCVEGWSMVIPWIGYTLSTLLKQVEPTGHAKFVEFITAEQAPAMRSLKDGVLDWPYTEALHMDEAMHPLTLLTFGVYGRELPNQNGAPLRVIIPWKYGFKSGKSLVTIRLVREQPKTSWVKAAPNEYGFYANVNPDVPHPRWSQANERRIGANDFFAPKRKTLMFNGYGDQVASLYRGLDLQANY